VAGTSQTALPPRTNTADDKPTADEQELLHRLDDLYEEGEGVRDERRDPKDVESDLNLFRGDVGPSKKYMAANFIEAFIDRMVAQLTDNRPIIRVEAYKAGLHPVARVMNKVVRTVWDDADMQRQAFKMAHLAASSASAGLYTGYDPARDEITLETLRLDQVVIDPKIREAARIGQAADYVFITRIVPLDELRVRFPGRGAAVEPDKRLSNLRVKKAGGKSVMSPAPSLASKTIRCCRAPKLRSVGSAIGHARPAAKRCSRAGASSSGVTTSSCGMVPIRTGTDNGPLTGTIGPWTQTIVGVGVSLRASATFNSRSTRSVTDWCVTNCCRTCSPLSPTSTPSRRRCGASCRSWTTR